MNTTNYGLHLTDDSATRFYDWRNQINGTNDSNMMKIDEVLGNKADSSVSVEAVLTVSGWMGNTAPYTQELVVEGLGVAQNGSIGVSQSATIAQNDTALQAILRVSGQEESKLIITANGTKPTVDIPVSITLLG